MQATRKVVALASMDCQKLPNKGLRLSKYKFASAGRKETAAHIH